MTTAPISTRIETRPTVTLLESPLTIVLAVPRTDFVPAPNVLIPVVNFPVNELTEITADNVAHLGAVPAADSDINTPMARAAYDYIEAGANVHVFALPFEVAAVDTAAQRATKVVTALNTTLNSATERAKLPAASVDVIVVPRECTAGTAANAVVTALETLCAPDHLECVALVDAGDITYNNDARPGAAEPSAADVKTWSGNNRHIHIYSLSNRGHVSHYNDMWGSVIAAAHHARYVSRNGIWAHPYNLRDPVLGVGTLTPQRVFDPGDASSSAIALERDDLVGSVVQYDGADYIWGGESYAGVEDPRQNIGNHVVANRMVKRARRIMARFLRVRARGSTIETLRLSIERPLVDLYVPNAVQDIQVRPPEFTSGGIKVRMPTAFYDFINSIELTAEVYHPEVT